MNKPPHIHQNESVILFDGVCVLCNGWSNFILRNDRGKIFHLCTVQSREGQDILNYLGLSTEHYETMVYIENHDAYYKSDAFIRVIRRMSYPYRTFALLRFVPATIRNWLYDRVALNRYSLFGKKQECPIPGAEQLERFIGKTDLPASNKS